jgi:hypothetical protein
MRQQAALFCKKARKKLLRLWTMGVGGDNAHNPD